MRYLLIDHITEWKPREQMRGIKNVTMSEDFLEFHFPKNPIMPGVLLFEALSQLSGWLEAVSSDFRNWFMVNRIRKCGFYGFAFPGDQVELEVRIVPAVEPDRTVFSGLGTVGGKKKISAEFEGTIVSMDTIERIEEQKNFFQILTRKPAL